MNNARSNQLAQDTAPAVSGLAVITVDDAEYGFNPGSDLWKGLQKQYSNQVCRIEISKTSMLLGDCLSEHSIALIVDSTSNGTKYGTVSLVDLSLSNQEEIRFNIPSNHGELIAVELDRIRKDGNLPSRLLLLGVEGPADAPGINKIASTVVECIPLNTASLILMTLLETFSTKMAC